MHTRHNPLGDWLVLARRLDAAGIPQCWKADPRLAGLRRTEQLRDWTRPGDPKRADQVLGALLRLAARAGEGDPDAAAVVLHLLLPGAIRIAARVRNLSTDPLGLVLGELAVQVRRYPLARRTHAHAANLLRTTEQEVWREFKRCRRDRSVPPELLVDPVADKLPPDGRGGRRGVLDTAVLGPDDDATQELVDMLMWARRSGAVGIEDLRILLAVEYARDEPGMRAPIASVAERYGCTVRTIQRHRGRALERLRALRGEYLAAITAA